LTEWIKKQTKNQDPTLCCLLETSSRTTTTQTEREGMEKQNTPSKSKPGAATVRSNRLYNKDCIKGKRKALHDDKKGQSKKIHHS